MKRTATRAKVWDARQLPAYLTPAEYAAGAGTDEFLAGVFIVDADMAE